MQVKYIARVNANGGLPTDKKCTQDGEQTRYGGVVDNWVLRGPQVLAIACIACMDSALRCTGKTAPADSWACKARQRNVVGTVAMVTSSVRLMLCRIPYTGSFEFYAC